MNLTKCTKSQRRVITTLDAPLMVSAGAGSGKTFTLTQRVAYALSPHDGQPPFLDSVDELLAITFTTKAADELKSRIKGLLLDEGLEQEALKADNAWVSTIHGMASRILREHALEIGIDPAFEVIGDDRRDELMEEALELVVRQARDGDDARLAELLRTEKLRGAGFNDKGLVDYAQAVLERVHAMPEGFGTLATGEGKDSPHHLMRLLEEAADRMYGEVSAVPKPSKSVSAFLEKLDAALGQVRAWLDAAPGERAAAFADDAFDAEAFCRAFYDVPPSTGARIGAAYQELFESWWETLVELDSRARVALAERWRDAVISAAHQVEGAYRRLKGTNLLDNTDLLLCCSQALRAHPAIAEELRRKFKLIMVDEFQDTDRLQVDIISRLAQPGLANVCTVGDAQQSIYRFRGADVNVFTEYRRNLEGTASEDAVVPMAKNFRSHGDILAFVERIFSQREVFGGDFLRLEAGGSVNEQVDPLFADRPRIQVNVVHGEAKKASIDDARQASAAAIARHFATLRDEGAPAGDMVILLGSMSNADKYAEALRAEGLPSMITGGSVFSRMPEPQLVTNLLRVAVNASDEEALYPVLASPLFAVSDDALLALASRRNEAGEWAPGSLARGFIAPDMEEALAAAGLPSDQVRAVALCRALLYAFASRAQQGACAEALRRLLVESGLLDRLQGDGVEGLAAAANYAKAVRLVAQLEEEAPGVASTAAAFQAHLESAKEAPGALATAANDFVSIMTVHSSKGLEFPHVAVAELRDGCEGAGRFVVENLGGHTYASAAFVPLDEWGDASRKVQKLAEKIEAAEPLDVSSVDSEALDSLLGDLAPHQRHEALAAFAEDQALAEARRLLYVALTRASKSLFVAIALGSSPSKGYEGKGIVSDIYQALAWDTSGARAVTMVDYGGSAPARVTVTALGAPPDADAAESAAGALDDEAVLPGDDEADEARAFVGDAGASGESAAGLPPFSVPVRAIPPVPAMVPRGFAHADLFSYSSLSGTHEHVDMPVGPDEGDGIEIVNSEGLPKEAACSSGGALGEDATALGRAFHRLAQQAIERSRRSALFCPGEAALVAQIQKEGLSDGQQERLRAALARWLASEVAARFASFETRSAEVPFTVRVPAASADGSTAEVPAGDFFLEGEIDGLADNGDGAAFLIDYKTGGSLDEAPEALDAKHRLQASCYAYALMRAGYTSVDAHFLRIEHASADNPRDPQVVSYHFDEADLPALEALIITKQREATA